MLSTDIHGLLKVSYVRSQGHQFMPRSSVIPLTIALLIRAGQKNGSRSDVVI